MAFISLYQGEATLNLLSELFKKINIHGGETIRLVKSSESLEILIDEKNIQKVKSLFTEGQINRIIKNIGIVNVNLNQESALDYENTPGVFSTILNELVMHNISVHEIILCSYEYMIFVDEKNLVETYEVLMKLCEK